MIATIAHRGPDDSGVWVDSAESIALGHRRLAILDLSAAGHQPMLSRSGRFVLILNGEIYNHLELRNELEARFGTQAWRGHSDTETLLEILENFDTRAALGKLVGMFAIAIWDRKRKVLTLARDRLGEKPLYFANMRGAIYFASELKALRAVIGSTCEIDRASLALYMRHNYVPAPRTIYKGVSKLTPASFVEFSSPDSPPSVHTYWDARETALHGLRNPFEGSESEAVDSLERVLRQAVSSQMISDVPLGAFLSGGIDSSLIVALMQSSGRARAKTFTIGFNEKQYDEAVFAREVARHLGTDHTEHYVSPEEARSVIPRLPEIYDEPFADSSQIPTFLVSQLARKHVTVSLSGDAGDELFGGYTRYLWTARIAKTLRFFPRGPRKTLAGFLRGSGTSSRKNSRQGETSNDQPGRFARLREKVDKVVELLDVENPTELYYGLVSHWKDPASVVVGGSEPLTRVTDSSMWLGEGGLENHMMYLDLVTYLPDDILVKVDRAAMSVALETRVPMLDHRVVEFAWSLPLKYKIRDRQGKWLLRQLLARHVPRQLFERPKTGFGIPIDYWLRGSLREWADDLLDPARLDVEGYFHKKPIIDKWNEHKSGRRNWGYYLWDVLMFQAWLARVREE